MEEKYILGIASLNLNEHIDIVNFYISRWNIEMPKDNLSKDFYLEIEEELDNNNLLLRYCALSKLFVSFLKIDTYEKYTFLSDNLTDYYNIVNISDAFEYGLLQELIQNLIYFYSKFNEYPKDLITLRKCELTFFIKINTYLIFLMLYFLKGKKDLKKYIIDNSDEIEEICLKFIKISNTNKYTPARILLCLYYVYFRILTNKDEDNKNQNSNNKIDKSKLHLTKHNYLEYFKPKIPLIFQSLSSNKVTNQVEKFYRRNMIKRDKPELERVIIVQILKILLSTFENNNKNQQNNNNISEFIKDYVIDIILKKFYFENILFGYIKEEEEENTNSNNNTNNNNSISDEQKDIFNQELKIKNFNEIIDNVNEDEKNYYLLIEIFNKLGITTIIICFYYNVLKVLQYNNLIEYSYFSFHLKDSNGLYVFLRILKQDFYSTEQNFIKSLENENISNLYEEITEITILYNLKLVYKIAYKNNEYLYKLIECKVPIMLKKVLINFEKNEKIKKGCLKLFKCQLKYFDKNWRIENVNIITSIYLTLKVRCDEDDNYLERKDKNNKEINNDYFNEEELKKLYQEFHEYNYLYYLNNPNLLESFLSNYSSSLYSRIYTKIKEKADQKE